MFAREHLLEKIQQGFVQIRSADEIPYTLEQCAVPPLLLALCGELASRVPTLWFGERAPCAW